MSRQTLLKNGTVIVLGPNDVAEWIAADVLINGDRIAKIEPQISVGDDVKIVDCTDKIVAPGFVDTHRHIYNTALRGRHGDDVLPDYLMKGILQGGSFDQRELFWGQLAGCAESINSGTTTVVDHSHLNYSKDRPEIAIRATVASGIRSIYGYCFTGRVDSWTPFSFNPELIAPFAVDSLKQLAKTAPFGNGRVTLGVAFDFWFLPQDIIQPLFEQVKAIGIKHITTHNGPSPPGAETAVEKMHTCGVMSQDSHVILSHANFMAAGDIDLIEKTGAYISSTPSVELQMGLGTPACFDHGGKLQSRASLGIDCHNATIGSIVNEMRCALVQSRGAYNSSFLAVGKLNAKMNHTVQEAYALGTIQGARAVGMENEIGSLAVGKKADIIIFDALAPSMVCAAQHDPITAIVMHSTPGDISSVFVDGILRKADGRILPVQVEPADAEVSGVTDKGADWQTIVKNLLSTQKTLQAKIDKLDLEAAKQGAFTAFGFNPAMIVDKL